MIKYDKRIAMRLRPDERQKIDRLVSEGKFENLSDVMRAALKKFLEIA